MTSSSQPLKNSQSSQLSAEFVEQYRALHDGAGWVDVSGRTQLEIRGADRAKFLHNLCTNNVNALEAGEGCEAFFTNVQGKILGHACLFQGADSIVLDAEPGQASAMMSHLDRYLIREDVELHDRSEQWGQVILSGQNAEQVLTKLIADTPPQQRLEHKMCSMNDVPAPVHLKRVEITGGRCFTLSGEKTAVEAVGAALSKLSITFCSTEVLETLRVESVWPRYGRDITEKNLPQEVDRNEKAISFTKGCYLGQETVARIDALGHVNRLLCSVQFDGEQVPTPDMELLANDKPIGWITSAIWSPQVNAPLAMAYLRREHALPGAQLTTSLGPARVVEKP